MSKILQMRMMSLGGHATYFQDAWFRYHLDDAEQKEMVAYLLLICDSSKMRFGIDHRMWWNAPMCWEGSRGRR